MPGNRVLHSALILAGLFFLLLIAVFTLRNSSVLAPAELARRCAESRPAWNGYQEDIKEIGARPVARWHGWPSRLTLSGATVRLVFELEPPWDNWNAALPVLLKTPDGQTFRNEGFVRDGTTCIYTFQLLADSDVSRPPWLEIQYPHIKQRLYLNAEGAWHGEPSGAIKTTGRPFSNEPGKTLDKHMDDIQAKER